MLLTMAEEGAENLTRKAGGKAETKQFPENPGFLVGGSVTVVSQARTAEIISLIRDMLLPIEGHGSIRLNTAYASHAEGRAPYAGLSEPVPEAVRPRGRRHRRTAGRAERSRGVIPAKYFLRRGADGRGEPGTANGSATPSAAAPCGAPTPARRTDIPSRP